MPDPDHPAVGQPKLGAEPALDFAQRDHDRRPVSGAIDPIADPYAGRAHLGEAAPAPIEIGAHRQLSHRGTP